MNREILFKGKRVDDGKWIYGDLLQCEGGRTLICTYVAPSKETEGIKQFEIDISLRDVIPETVSQYTGLNDKYGNKIWENDIVSCQEEEDFGQINWNESEAGFYFDILLNAGHFCEESIDDHLYCMEVIGNVFDNPELLEGGAEE